MTLIIASLSSDDGLFAASDLMITNTRDRLQRDASHLPLRRGIVRRFPTVATRIMSKAVLWKNFIFLWSGSVLECRKIIEDFILADPRSIDATMRHLQGMRKTRSQIIIGHNDGNEIDCFSINCGKECLEKWSMEIGGSGSQYAIDILEEFENSREVEKAQGSGIVKLVFELVLRENYDEFFGILDFGGGYELFAPNPDGGFHRVPYWLLDLGYGPKFIAEKSEHIDFVRCIRHSQKDNDSIFDVILPSKEGPMSSTRTNLETLTPEVVVSEFKPEILCFATCSIGEFIYFETGLNLLHISFEDSKDGTTKGIKLEQASVVSLRENAIKLFSRGKR